ncbi:MAG: GDSL-type esterase/lipase family protein [Vicinamibacterales bacterium]
MTAGLRRIVAVAGMAVAVVFASPTHALQVQPAREWPTVANREVRPPSVWEEAITKFEAADRATPPPENGVVFVGASSIVRWNLPEYFPELGASAINRGFGGSLAADSTYFADRIVIPYKPRVVVFYAGDNDVETPTAPEQIAAAFFQFEQKVHAALPDTKIVFISIKPSLRRFAFMDKLIRANALVKDYIGTHQNLVYMDIVPPMLNAEGKPRPELLVEDGLHMTAEGYKVWTAALKPLLASMMTSTNQ